MLGALDHDDFSKMSVTLRLGLGDNQAKLLQGKLLYCYVPRALMRTLQQVLSRVYQGCRCDLELITFFLTELPSHMW